MVKAESSSTGARNGIKANTSGAGTIYELPWYPDLNQHLMRVILTLNTGLRNTGRSTLTT